MSTSTSVEAEADVEADAIADCVLEAFNALPSHRKPRQASSGLKAGRREWVPLAGIVIASGSGEPAAKRLKCVALATGMKCLPQDKIDTLHGNVIHDSHAEILAQRAFNRFLLDQCADLAARGTSAGSENGISAEHIIEWRAPASIDLESDTQSVVTATEASLPLSKEHLWCSQPFQIKQSVKIHMYCSEAPCGDASMELTMAAQDDPTPWSRTPDPQSPCTDTLPGAGLVKAGALPTDDESGGLFGRSYFDALGVVRRKPSRPDAPPTLSKSCSDKIALKQSTSILSSIASLLIHPSHAYIASLTMPSSQLVDTACQRAFGPSGRMSLLEHNWDHFLLQAGYSFRPFKVRPTTREFSFSRRNASSKEAMSVVPSNIASLKYGSGQETLINGVLQGRKQNDPRGASAVSRRKMWSLALSIAGLVGERAIIQALSRPTYQEIKSSGLLQAREMAKEITRLGPLRGWKRNLGDDGWCL